MVPNRGPQSRAEQDKRTWHLVALGDSTPTGYGVGARHSYVQVFAGYVQDDLAVDVVVHNWATNEIRKVADWVEVVRTSQDLRRDLRTAQAITIWLGWHDVIPSIGVGEDSPCYQRAGGVDVDCLADVTGPMEDGFDDLLSEVVSLASPGDALMLAADTGIPARFVEMWLADGTFEAMREHAYEAWRDYLIHAASRRGVCMVPTYEAINGPDGDRPLPPEYWQSDRVHFSQRGHELIADLHRRTGYGHIRQYGLPGEKGRDPSVARRV